jgi:HlyD family secretion protein
MLVAGPEQSYRATVTEKGGVVEETGGSEPSPAAVRGAFIDVPKGYTPGDTMPCRIVVKTHPNVLSLPRGPFLTTGGGLVLYRIEGTTARRIDAALGVTTSAEVEIARGVKEGDRIIISSYQDFTMYDTVALAPGGGTNGDSPAENQQDLRPGSGQD